MPTKPFIFIKENYPLKPLTTFKIGGKARFFAPCKSAGDLKKALLFAKKRGIKLLIVGGSSNMLISDRGFNGLATHLEILGREILSQNKEQAIVKLSAGENWDECAAWAVKQNFWGVENLSHIPGQAGAAAVQNIGAYGQQISDVLESLEALDTQSGRRVELNNSDCEFGYRKSIFNTTHRGRYVILSLTLKLSKQPRPNLSYGDVKRYFSEKKITQPVLRQIRQAIIEIRDRKYPYPVKEVGGNAGSFFKNIHLPTAAYQKFLKKFKDNFGQGWQTKLEEQVNRFSNFNSASSVKSPAVVRLRRTMADKSGGYQSKLRLIKIPTAFLIEACGLPGFQMGNVKVNEAQPLVLLNQGGATAKEVLALAKHIRNEVYKKTGQKLQVEPELVGFTGLELAGLVD